MLNTWRRVGSRSWWVVMTLFFLGIELLLRIKLGSIYVMASAGVLAQVWLAGRLGDPLPERDQGRRFFYALYAALVACVVIFLVFAVLNIGLRSVNNDWRWFQLP
jgi:hypothetical protein